MGKAFEGRPQKSSALFETTKWKQKAIDELLKDDKLMKLLKYPTPDCLSKPDLTEDERLDLVNNQIFGFRYIPQVAETQKSYISMGVGGFVPQEGYRQFSNEYLMGYFYFYILVDNAIFVIDNGWRQDAIMERIYHIFNDSRIVGIGEMRLETQLENWQQNNNFGGYTLGFRVVSLR